MRHWYIIFPGSPDLLQFFPFNLIELKYILENPDSSGGKESSCHVKTLFQFLGQEDLLEKG